MIRIALIVAALSATSSIALAAEGDPITESEKPVLAAARIFALENRLHGDIGVADEDEAHIGERFEVNHAPGKKCAFTMRHRDGPIVETLDFAHLSGEHHVHRDGAYARLVVPGKPGIEMLLKYDTSAPTELDLAVRALRYISGVCPTVEMPF